MPETEIVLSIDSSDELASISLQLVSGDGDSKYFGDSWIVGTTIAQELLDKMDKLLTRANIERHELTKLVVISGPGRYASLRVGLATVQGLSLGLDIPAASVPRFYADAWNVSLELTSSVLITVLHDAKSTGVVAQKFNCTGPTLFEEYAQPEVYRLEELAEKLPAGGLIAGDLTDRICAQLPAGLQSKIIPENSDPRRTRALAALEYSLAHASIFKGAEQIDALYVRPPNITSRTER